ncbi:MAG: succinate dehydrogenase, cytochrome b556 subunit [Rhizomicrobium sp.]
MIDLKWLAPTLPPGSETKFGEYSMVEQAKSARPRPLSPHVQIYRWPVTMATSIVHRVSGVALAAGTLLVVWWLIATATGTDYYDTFSAAARSPLGILVLFGFVWSLAYHLSNGIRHLVWDAGFGFDIKTAGRTGVFVFALSFIIAVAIFGYAYAVKGVMP